MSTALVCPACGKQYSAGPTAPWRCSCGSPLEFDAPLSSTATPPSHPQGTGIWDFQSLLPIAGELTLGEAWTPIVAAGAWPVEFKLEYLAPTGSFKDRGAAAIVDRAQTLGVDRIIEDSSGNAGAAIATYAAHANLDAEIFVPDTTPAGKLRPIERAGATIHRIDGPRSAATDAAIAAVEQDSTAWYASHAWHPAFFAGTMTFGIELGVQRAGSLPDALVLPVGNGTLLLGAYRGLKRLQTQGSIDQLPRLYAAQAAGYAPLTASTHTETNELADGIQITTPPREHQLRAAVNETGGDTVVIGSEATQAALDRLHQSGFYVEPTCAVPVAAVELLQSTGEITAADDVIVPLTGSGLANAGPS